MKFRCSRVQSPSDPWPTNKCIIIGGRSPLHVYEQKYQDNYAVRSCHQINDSPTLEAGTLCLKVKIDGSQLRADAVRVHLIADRFKDIAVRVHLIADRFKDIAVRVHLIADRFKDIPWTRITHGVRETCQLDPLWMSKLTASAMTLWMHLQYSCRILWDFNHETY
jgi:hypothetical protein